MFNVILSTVGVSNTVLSTPSHFLVAVTRMSATLQVCVLTLKGHAGFATRCGIPRLLAGRGNGLASLRSGYWLVSSTGHGGVWRTSDSLNP